MLTSARSEASEANIIQDLYEKPDWKTSVMVLGAFSFGEMKYCKYASVTDYDNRNEIPMPIDWDDDDREPLNTPMKFKGGKFMSDYAFDCESDMTLWLQAEEKAESLFNFFADVQCDPAQVACPCFAGATDSSNKYRIGLDKTCTAENCSRERGCPCVLWVDTVSRAMCLQPI